jgi:hypothetical protein
MAKSSESLFICCLALNAASDHVKEASILLGLEARLPSVRVEEGLVLHFPSRMRL